MWVKRDDLIVPLKVHKRQPSKMFMAVLKALLSDEVLKSGCVSYSGRKGKTAKIPSDIITAALGKMFHFSHDLILIWNIKPKFNFEKP